VNSHRKAIAAQKECRFKSQIVPVEIRPRRRLRFRMCWWSTTTSRCASSSASNLSRANDFRVSEAATGAQMMGAFRAQVVDLVLLDLRLQGEDGMQLLRRLRAESQLPVIILTGPRRGSRPRHGPGAGRGTTISPSPSVRGSSWPGSAPCCANPRGQEVHGAPVCRAYRIPGVGAEPAHAQAARARRPA